MSCPDDLNTIITLAQNTRKKCKATPCELIMDNCKWSPGNSTGNSGHWQGRYVMYQYVLDKILKKPRLTDFHDFSVLYFLENLDRWCRQLSAPRWKNTRKFFVLQGKSTATGEGWLISTQYIDSFNHFAEQYLQHHPTDIMVWRSRATLENYIVRHAPWHSGVHMTDSVYDEELQLLLNHLIT